MAETQVQTQTQTQDQAQDQTQIQKLAQKLLIGEQLTPQEAALLTDGGVVKKVSHYLWHYTFWGW